MKAVIAGAHGLVRARIRELQAQPGAATMTGVMAACLVKNHQLELMALAYREGGLETIEQLSACPSLWCDHTISVLVEVTEYETPQQVALTTDRDDVL